MTQLVPFRPATPTDTPVPVDTATPLGTSGLHAHLPGDIYAEYASLKHAYERSEAIAAEADGQWGPFGFDALTGLVPVVGALYTAFTLLRLQGCAANARCPMGIRFTGFLLAGIDIAVGIFIGIGDVVDALFRSSAIFAGMIQSDIRRKLLLIETAEQQRRETGYLTDADITRLRDHLLRGGRSEAGQGLRTLLGMGLLLLLLYSCAGG